MIHFKLTNETYRSVPEYKQYMSRDFSYNFDNVLSYTKSIRKIIMSF